MTLLCTCERNHESSLDSKLHLAAPCVGEYREQEGRTASDIPRHAVMVVIGRE